MLGEEEEGWKSSDLAPWKGVKEVIWGGKEVIWGGKEVIWHQPWKGGKKVVWHHATACRIMTGSEMVSNGFLSNSLLPENHSKKSCTDAHDTCIYLFIHTHTQYIPYHPDETESW
jgi:hypothetical protein